jgi:phage shock protein E
MGRFVFVLFVAAALAFAYMYAMSSPYRITSADAKQRIRDKQVDVILDVRTLAERATLGYYPGSVHIESADLAGEMARRYPNKATRILVYCNTGQRARRATDTLRALGYTNTRYIAASHLSLMD